MHKVLQDAARFIHNAFLLSTPKPKNTVTLVVKESLPNDAPAETGGSHICLSANYKADWSGDSTSLTREITGVLYHESTYINNPEDDKGNYPEHDNFPATIEGMADWVRIRAGFPNSTWPKLERGGDWNVGYQITGYFFIWIKDTQLKPNFVNELNKKMEEPWWEILRKKLADLWPVDQNTL